MRIIVLAALTAIVSVPAAADEVTLKNGDQVTGKVAGLAGGKLQVDTEHAGSVKIDWSEIASIKTDAPVKVKLQDGTTIDGRLSMQDGKLKVDATDVDPAAVKSMNEPALAWHGGVDLAARASDGNTHTTSILLQGEAKFVAESYDILTRAIWRYGKASGELSERNFYGMGKYAYHFSPVIYGYASAEFFSDSFKDLRLRTILSAGAGWHAIKSDEMELSVEGGLAYVIEDLRRGDDEDFLGARLAAHFRRALPLGFEFVDDVVFFPNFEEGDAWLLHNEASIGTSLGAGWTLKAGMITDYNNDAPDGVRKYDNVYYVGLGFKF